MDYHLEVLESLCNRLESKSEALDKLTASVSALAAGTGTGAEATAALELQPLLCAARKNVKVALDELEMVLAQTEKTIEAHDDLMAVHTTTAGRSTFMHCDDIDIEFDTKTSAAHIAFCVPVIQRAGCLLPVIDSIVSRAAAAMAATCTIQELKQDIARVAAFQALRK